MRIVGRSCPADSLAVCVGVAEVEARLDVGGQESSFPLKEFDFVGNICFNNYID